MEVNEWVKSTRELSEDELLSVRSMLPALQKESQTELNKQRITELFRKLRVKCDIQNIPALDSLLFILVHSIFQSAPLTINRAMIKELLKAHQFPEPTNLNRLFKMSALQYLLMNSKIGWNSLIEGFDSKNWRSIDEIARLVPISQVKLADLQEWIAAVVRSNPRDGGIGIFDEIIQDWMLYCSEAADEVNEALELIAVNSNVNMFLGSFVKGIEQRTPSSLQIYIKRLETLIQTENALQIFLGIAQVGIDRDINRHLYYRLLEKKINESNITQADFLNICTVYGFSDSFVQNLITLELKGTNDTNLILSILRYLERLQDLENYDWYRNELNVAFSKMNEDLTYAQSHFLSTVSNKDLVLAYEVFTLRMQIMGGNQFLEAALVNMVEHNKVLFQKKIVEWLVSDDEYIYYGIRAVCSSHDLHTRLFYIDSAILEDFQNADKLFMAYKTVGFVYDKDKLQQLLISLAVSVEQDNDNFVYDGFLFIFSEYLVGNYRGTLELLKKETIKTGIPSFARKLFNQIIEEYEKYFNALDNIPLTKELKPYPRHHQLRDFYYNRLFLDIPKKLKEDSLLNFFKNVTVNSDSWAIKRPGELIHDPQVLGRISLTTEFPAGESLDPVFHEEIRRTYQKIKINEVRNY
jgi:hypothetical protein